QSKMTNDEARMTNESDRNLIGHSALGHSSFFPGRLAAYPTANWLRETLAAAAVCDRLERTSFDVPVAHAHSRPFTRHERRLDGRRNRNSHVSLDVSQLGAP